jgi:hypothetical protein
MASRQPAGRQRYMGCGRCMARRLHTPLYAAARRESNNFQMLE